MLPAARVVTTTNFTATDGAYFGLAQTIGADPNAFGVADQLIIANDVGDPSQVGSYMRAKSVGTGRVLQVFAGTGEGGADRLVRLGYDGVVVFSAAIDVSVITAKLYLGKGVGATGGLSHHEAVLEDKAGDQTTPKLHLSGEVALQLQGFNPSTSGIPNVPTISPILLVTGGSPTVIDAWFELTILTPFVSELSFP